MLLKYITNKDNITLRTILKNNLCISSKLLSKLKNGKCIFVNGKIQNVDYITSKGDIVEVNLSNMDKVDFTTIPAYPLDLDVLYEDEYILVINKPYNIETHPSFTNYDKTIANAVMYYYQTHNIQEEKVHIITRLDKNTSGICIIAKNIYIQELFKRKKDELCFKKEYLAVVNGIVEKESDIIEEKIARKENTIILREVNNATGEYAKTEYTVLSRNYEKNFTVLGIILHTGRTHQIRVHLSYIGHTLLGDDLYASLTEKENITKYISRQALHAYKVSFIHPITHEKIILQAKIPDDISNIM